MITKVGSRVYEKQPYPSLHPKLSLMERSLLRWAVIDRDDRVLDAGLGNGYMVDYLRRNMECEVCGVSDNMELVRQTRSLVRSADLVYAADGEIPWRDRAFDAVLMRLHRGDEEGFERLLKEIRRVLKDGGQLVMAVECCPGPLHPLFKALAAQEEPEGEALSRKTALRLLNRLGFQHLTWQRANLLGGVLIAWKRNPLEEEAKDLEPER